MAEQLSEWGKTKQVVEPKLEKLSWNLTLGRIDSAKELKKKLTEIIKLL